MPNDLSNSLREQVENAFKNKTPLWIQAGNSKNFYGNKVDAQAINITEHKGITEYQPSELVVTVRSGTLLSELETELKANKQMLAFEPPQHTTNTTIGGAIACGLSGPRRVACGSARDFVLGTTIINGKAEQLRFGGQVMKNVAGYDASRLMVGAQGTLGILLDVSLKVLPISDTEVTLQFTTDLDTSVKHIQQWLKQGLPISASCHFNNILTLRLSSTHSAVKKSASVINTSFNTEEINNDFWLSIKNQSHSFFSEENINDDENLWRCSHQAHTDFYDDIDYSDTKNQLVEWNGALRWIKSAQPLYKKAEAYNGHSTLYPVNQTLPATDLFQPLQPGLMKIHQRMKQAFDPENILNPGRLYTDI
jgi:glycolate oxidase FAD binding subunit